MVLVLVPVPSVNEVRLGHETLAVITQLIDWPFVRELVVKVEALVPALLPSTFHCQAVTVPPDIDALKVAELPWQSGFVPAVWLMIAVGLPIGLIFCVRLFELAVELVVHSSFEVITQLITCPFEMVVDV